MTYPIDHHPNHYIYSALTSLIKPNKINLLFPTSKRPIDTPNQFSRARHPPSRIFHVPIALYQRLTYNTLSGLCARTHEDWRGPIGRPSLCLRRLVGALFQGRRSLARSPRAHARFPTAYIYIHARRVGGHTTRKKESERLVARTYFPRGVSTSPAANPLHDFFRHFRGREDFAILLYFERER